MTTPRGMRAKSIGHYMLGKTIGEGTFGKVKLGTHILTGEKVAVKILEKERIVDVADVERVAREIHILKLVQHPHIIQLYEIIETPRQLYLIMEYCSGGELFDHIVANGRVREREACKFFHQILAGVELIHKVKVVHRDLKPENLLLDDRRDIKIVDFGLSNTFEDGQLLKTACGSPCYAAPEMIAGHRYKPSCCDIWSCGVILFALVCGYLPFEDQNTAALYRKILNADYQAPRFISDTVRDLVVRMLTIDPERRITVPRIRAHAWYRQIPEASRRPEGDRGEIALEQEVLEQLDRFGFPREYAVKCLQMSKHNHVTTTYFLLLEKWRRGGGQPQALEAPVVFDGMSNAMEEMDAFTGAASSGGGMGELEMLVDRASREMLTEAELTADVQGDFTGLDPQLYPAADADCAAGGSPVPALDLPSGSGRGNTTRSAFGRADRGDSLRRSQASGEALPAPRRPPLAGGGPGPRLSARAAAATGRAEGPATPRAATGTAGASTGPLPTPRRRSPVQQASSMPTPRGPMPAPMAPAHGHTPRHSAASAMPGMPGVAGMPGYRSSLPGGAPLSAREQPTSRPGTSQSVAPPARPSGPATARVNEARRRHFSAAESPNSARGTRPASGSLAAAAAAPTSARGVANVYGAAPAWAAPRPPAAVAAYAASIRAASASPDVGCPTYDGGPMPLSAREAQDEEMRTCRGAFNVSCTSSKSPKQILQEVSRALGLNRVAFKQASPFLVKCQKQGFRFEMEIAHLDHLESMYVVRFRRAAGELAAYRELCSKILAEMNI